MLVLAKTVTLLFGSIGGDACPLDTFAGRYAHVTAERRTRHDHSEALPTRRPAPKRSWRVPWQRRVYQGIIPCRVDICPRPFTSPPNHCNGTLAVPGNLRSLALVGEEGVVCARDVSATLVTNLPACITRLPVCPIR